MFPDSRSIQRKGGSSRVESVCSQRGPDCEKWPSPDTMPGKLEMIAYSVGVLNPLFSKVLASDMISPSLSPSPVRALTSLITNPAAK